jgi:hypothetical protein
MNRSGLNWEKRSKCYMKFDIVQITQQISVSSPNITADWPSFVAWISNQVPRRSIVGHYDWGNLKGWSDDWSSAGYSGDSSGASKRSFDSAVLSTEVVGLLKAPPISLSNDDAIALRNHLVGMGLLVAHYFQDGRPCNSIIQFRI